MRLNVARDIAILDPIDRRFTPGVLAGLDEAQLLDRFVEHQDHFAFEALVKRFGPMVLSVCKQLLHDPNDVEDAFQATFLVLLRKGPSIRDADLLGNWLYGVAYKVASRARADALKRQDRERSQTLPVEPSTLPLDEAERQELRAALHDELTRLPEKYRDPVVLCHLEGFSHAEAARRLRWPIGTVRGRLARARDLLRDRLTRRGFTGASVAVAALFEPSRTYAFLPKPLIAETVRVALAALTARGITTALTTASVATLTNGVLTTMTFTPFKLGTTALVATGLFVAGAGSLARSGFGSGDPVPEERPPVVAPVVASLNPGSDLDEQDLNGESPDELPKAANVGKMQEHIDLATYLELSKAENAFDDRIQQLQHEHSQTKRSLDVAKVMLQRVETLVENRLESRENYKSAQKEVQDLETKLEQLSEALQQNAERRSEIRSLLAAYRSRLREEPEFARVERTRLLTQIPAVQDEIEDLEVREKSAINRHEWAQRMHELGYITHSQLRSDELSARRAQTNLAAKRAELEELEHALNEAQADPVPGPASDSGSHREVSVLNLSGSLDARLEAIEAKLDRIIDALRLNDEPHPK